MPVFLAFNLTPATQSGLTLTAKCYTGSAAAVSVALTESPASSARYTASTSGLTASSVYQITVVNASNVAVSYGGVTVDANGNDADVTGRPSNLLQIAGQTASAAGAVTFPASIGTSTLAAGAQMDLVNAPNATAITAFSTGFWDTLRSATRVAGSFGQWIKDVATGAATVRATDGSGAALATDAGQTSILSAVNNLNNLSALASLFGPAQLEIPDSGTSAYPLTLVVRDGEGHLIDLDATPTIAVANAAGTSRAANLSAVTRASLGVYTFTYTVNAADAEEGLRMVATGAVAASARRADAILAIVNYDTLTTLNAVKAKTDLIGTNAADSANAATAQTSISGIAAGSTVVRANDASGNAIATAGAQTTAQTDLTAIKAKTTNLPASPAATSDVQVTVSGGFTSEDRTTLGSRLAASSYATPPTADAIADEVVERSFGADELADALADSLEPSFQAVRDDIANINPSEGPARTTNFDDTEITLA